MITVKHVRKTEYDTISALRDSWKHHLECSRLPIGTRLFDLNISILGDCCACCKLGNDGTQTCGEICPLGTDSGGSRCCEGLWIEAYDSYDRIVLGEIVSKESKKAEKILADYIYDIYLQALIQEKGGYYESRISRGKGY